MSFFNKWRIKKELRLYVGDANRNIWVKEQKKSNKKRIIIWFLLTFIVALNFYLFKVSQVSILTAMTLFLLGIVNEIINRNGSLKDTINQLQTEQEYIESKVTRQITANQKIKKQYIKHIILKDDEGYDLKTWKIDHLYSLVIGKKNPKNHVEIDLTNTMYSALISREHGILNRCDEGWYYEDLGSLNGSGIKKSSNGRKVKVPNGRSIKVESGDILYISNTRLLLD